MEKDFGGIGHMLELILAINKDIREDVWGIARKWDGWDIIYVGGWEMLDARDT